MQEIHSRRTCLEHSDSPVFLREFTERAVDRKLRGDVLKLVLFDPILPTDSNGIYHENGEVPWLCSFTGGYRQMSFLAGNKNLWNQVLRQARIPLHLEGEHGGGFKHFLFSPLFGEDSQFD